MTHISTDYAWKPCGTLVQPTLLRHWCETVRSCLTLAPRAARFNVTLAPTMPAPTTMTLIGGTAAAVETQQGY